MDPFRRHRVLQKVAEKKFKAVPLVRSDAFDPTPVKLEGPRSPLAEMISQRFGNVSMGEQGPAWKREIPTKLPGLSLTSERPVDLRIPSTYGAKYQLGDDTSAGLQYRPGGMPRATFETALGGGTLSANLQGKPTLPGQGTYQAGVNYSIPLSVPRLKDTELNIDANVGGMAGAGAPIAPSNYGVNVAFGGRF